jgi:hypothetical protein
MRLFDRHREGAVSEAEGDVVVVESGLEFVVVEEAIGRFALYPLAAAPVRQSGRDKQGAVPPLGWPMPNGRVENTMTMRF